MKNKLENPLCLLYTSECSTQYRMVKNMQLYTSYIKELGLMSGINCFGNIYFFQKISSRKELVFRIFVKKSKTKKSTSLKT